VEVTALLVRYCRAKYPNLKYVFSHALVDPARRSDPGAQFDWERFIDLIASSENDPRSDRQALALAERVARHPKIEGLQPGEDCCM